jgi:hypothetical protein
MKILAVAGLAAALVAGAVASVRLVRAKTDQAEYADAPFEPVGGDFPRIIRVRESVPWLERARIGRFLTQDGAIRNASPEEREAVMDVTASHYLASREPNYLRGGGRARKVLRVNPESVPALYALGAARHYGEANLPRALFDVRRARHLLEGRGRQDPRDADSREWYLRVLEEEYRILADMDRPEEELRVVELLEKVYQPLPWLKVFPLIKLKRLDDAERAYRLMEGDGGWETRVLNTRAMLAEARRDRHGCYAAGKDMAGKKKYSAVLWHNFGLGCVNDFRLDEAEKAFGHSANLPHVDYHGSPCQRLAVFHLQQGRVPEAWEAFKRGQGVRGTRPAHTLEQDQTFADRSFALLMLAVGRGEDAERFARRAYERPGRTGNTTDDQRTHTLLSGLVLWMALDTRVEELREAGAAGAGARGMVPDPRVQALRVEAWRLRRHLLEVLGDEAFLNELIRPYLPGQDDKESWVMPTVIRVLPPGVAVEAIRRARQAEGHPEAVPYFDALDAEVALIRGRPEEACRFARQALAKLPAAHERALRARVAAVGGEAARRLGQADECLALSGMALRDFPEAFRLLQLTIPVSIEHDGSPEARLLAEQLLRSPRFRADPAGFRAVLRRVGGRLRMALFRAGQEVHFEAAVSVGGDGDPAAALRRFHVRMMSPVLDLSATDVNTVGGLPVKQDEAGTRGTLRPPSSRALLRRPGPIVFPLLRP